VVIDERGSATVQNVVLVPTMFLFVCMVLMLLLWAYAQGVVHAAADQAVRAGSRIDVDSVATCQARGSQTLTNALPGLGPGDVSCSESAGVVSVSIRLPVTGGIPPFRSTTLTADASARKEVAPD
jgi:Flp pilus assembly protein TadG